MQPKEFSTIALALPHVTEKSHMGHPDFRVGGKIFATLWPVEKRAVVKLTPGDQALRLDMEPDVFYPANGAWGKSGWTNIMLERAEESSVASALQAAWLCVAPQKLKRAFKF